MCRNHVVLAQGFGPLHGLRNVYLAWRPCGTLSALLSSDRNDVPTRVPPEYSSALTVARMPDITKPAALSSRLCELVF